MWLGESVWATHGHYLNHYLRPVSSYGLHPPTGVEPATPAESEYVSDDPAREPHLRDGMLPERWLDRHWPTRLAPLSSFLLDRQMQRHSLPAMLGVVQALGVEADWVIFGHVHRRGPRERDDPARWSGQAGRPRLLNTGCWRYEPVVVQAPRRPGLLLAGRRGEHRRGRRSAQRRAARRAEREGARDGGVGPAPGHIPLAFWPVLCRSSGSTRRR